ncbi:MAG: LysM peptidoglycan-binding domain-containing protein, partial [Anaerolineales bacterium]
VNDLRTSNGLEPYQVDGALMALAQAHSDYQASINERTHTRADGTGPGDHGLSSENIGGGFNVSAQTLFNQWADYWHTFTLIGFTSGKVGVGVATGSDGYLYYTLVVVNTGKKSGLPDEQPPDADPQSTGSAASSTPFFTVTPQDDGTITHIVAEGQTLWDFAIAYELTIVELSNLNNLDPENPVIYPGQAILIRQAYTVTPTGTITNTPLPPTRTLRPSRTPQPSRMGPSITATEAETQIPLLPESEIVNKENLEGLGVAIIIIAGLGLVAIIIGSIWWRRKS